MSKEDRIFAEIGAHLGSSIDQSRPLGGGCVAQARLLLLADGRKVFAKYLATHTEPSPFFAEAQGLQALSIDGGVGVPDVLGVDAEWLVLEAIISAPPAKDYQESFGRHLARTHRARFETIGFPVNHTIGATPQQNAPECPATPGNWIAFWQEYRLQAMLHHLEQSAFADQELCRAVADHIDRIPAILDGFEEAPTILHGDLWSGNHMPDEHGQAVIFDPAAYYGHREADLAMTRMFGGFGPDFYRAYDETAPLQEGWDERLNLYMLYHVLNHVVLYGSSYRHQAMLILRHFA